MLRKPGRVIGLVVVVFWVAMMGLMLYYEVVIPQSRRAAFSPPAFPQDVWMGLYMGEQRVGFFHTQSAPVIEDGVEGTRLRVLAQLRLSLFARETELFVSGKAFRTHEGRANFDFTLESGEQHMRVEGTAGGGRLDVNLHTAGEVLPFSFPISDDIIFSMGLDFPLQQAYNLEPGDEVYVDAFDPVMMKVSRARIRAIRREALVLGEEVVEALVVETTIGTFTTRAWIDDRGDVLQADTPLGFTLRKIEPSAAVMDLEGRRAGGDLVQEVSIAPEGIQPEEGIRAMAIRVGGVELDAFPPDEPGQFRDDDLIHIRPFMPVPGQTPGEPLSDEARTAALRSDPFVSSDHPTIVEKAREIVGDETRPWQQAVLVNEWLYEELEKIPVISVPAALDVLRTKQGDCNEHAVLFAALTRALEIPTRIAIGLVWSNELDAFGYHAWPEVFHPEFLHWIPMEPTLGQTMADATHIKLLNGGVEQWAQLLPFIGRLQIEVVAVE